METKKDREHTHIEIENIRYLYIPLDEFYLVLITNKNSNIIQDIDILKFFQRIIIDKCPQGINEESISENAFDLILSFDDVINMGYRESVTLQQIQTYLEMESSEEKLFIKLQKMKENEAREILKRSQIEIEKRLKSEKKKEKKERGASGANFEAERLSQLKEPAVYDLPVEAPQPKKTSTGKGMKLFAKSKQKESLISSLKKEGEIVQQLPTHMSKQEIEQKVEEEEKVSPLKEGVILEVEEKLILEINKDGDLSKFEVKGVIFLTLTQQAKLNTHIKLNIPQPKGITMKPHPELNKPLWNSKRILAPTNTERGFPVNQKIEAVKYRYSSSQEGDIPVSATIWSATEGSQNTITLELEYNSGNPKFDRIENLRLLIAFPTSNEPEISKCENSKYLFTKEENILEWSIRELNNEKTSATLEFVTDSDIDSILPIQGHISYEFSVLNLDVLSVIHQQTNQNVTYDLSKKFKAESFKIIS